MSLARVGATHQWADSRHSIDTLTDAWIGWQTSPSTSFTWETANTAVYLPVRVPRRVTVVQLGCANNTTGTGNIDIGIYYPDGTRLISTTSTAKGTTAAIQVIDITDTVLGPGMYYLALNCSNNTDTFYGLSDAAPLPAARGVLTEAVGAVTLPATATWVVNNTMTKIPVISAMLNTVVT